MSWSAKAVILGLGLAAVVPLASHADDDDHDDRDERREHDRGARRERGERGPGSGPNALAAPEWAVYREECGSCHVAFSPRLLPEASWRKVMGGLADHFGQNAEVDEATRIELTAFLSRWAGRSRGEAPLRITELSRWRHEHDEIAPAVWRRPAVGSRANCAACHPNADQGDFEERRVKIPPDASPGR